ncbi:MAG: type II CAAX endopeptidase family protein [Armatimonadota bacterium]|nr:type II CAAX endopeptidase family protein [Armatimonadota bacterium]
MRDSARYAWWLLVLLFSFAIFWNVFMFAQLFFGSPAHRSRSGMQVNLLTRRVLFLNDWGFGRSVVAQVVDTLAEGELSAPYEATLFKVLLREALGVGDPERLLGTLPDLPSDSLTPLQRRWQAARWQALFQQPPKPEAIPNALESLHIPSPLLRDVAEVALLRQAGDTARADALLQSLSRSASYAMLTVLVILACAGFGVVVGMILLVWYVFSRPPLPPRPEPSESPFVFDPLLWALVIFMLAISYLPVLRLWFLQWGIDAFMPLYLAAVLLPLAYLHSIRREPNVLGRIHWFQGSWGEQLQAGLMSYAMYLPLLLGLLAITFWVIPALPAEQVNPVGEEGLENRTIGQWLWTFVRAAVLAPIVEEFVFRGVLFKVLWQRTGRVWLSAFVSGYLFAVIHPQFLGGIFPLTVFGTVAALAYAHTRSLLPCIVLHALNNGVLVIMLWASAG